MLRPDPDAFDAIVRHGRPALAWEVLRRNPSYQAAFAQLGELPSFGDAATPAFAADWGLHFP